MRGLLRSVKTVSVTWDCLLVNQMYDHSIDDLIVNPTASDTV